jgi:hypothetical protein
MSQTAEASMPVERVDRSDHRRAGFILLPWAVGLFLGAYTSITLTSRCCKISSVESPLQPPG